MGEQTQRHQEIQDNPHNQNRERDQRGEDHEVWRIAGGIGHGVTAWDISVRGTSTTPAPKSIGSDPAIGLYPTGYSRPLLFLRSIYR